MTESSINKTCSSSCYSTCLTIDVHVFNLSLPHNAELEAGLTDLMGNNTKFESKLVPSLDADKLNKFVIMHQIHPTAHNRP